MQPFNLVMGKVEMCKIDKDAKRSRRPSQALGAEIKTVHRLKRRDGERLFNGNNMKYSEISRHGPEITDEVPDKDHP